MQYTCMDIVLEEENGEETHLCHAIKRDCPRNGEYIWMPYNWEKKKEFGRAFIVTDVAHHIGADMKISYDSVVIYVAKVVLNESSNEPIGKSEVAN